MNFASDNTAGVPAAMLDALAHANHGPAMGYGNDDLTRAVERRIGEVFECDAAVFLVTTGTAANALALAHIAPPWGGVLCHAEAHIATDECGAPEFVGGGLKLIGLDGVGCRLAPETLRGAIARNTGHRPHAVQAAAVSLAQVTEAGTIYTVDDVTALAAIAHGGGLKVHMDGARFANALVRLGVSPDAMSWRAGIDVLSFGATKGGALAAEAVVIFDRAQADAMHERRKRGGHLVSKQRFVAAQFDAFLADDNWLRLGAPRQPHGRPSRRGARGRRPHAGVAGRSQSRVRRAAGANPCASRRRGRPLLRAAQRQPAGRYRDQAG